VRDGVRADLAFAVANGRESVPTGTPGKWAAALMEARVARYEGPFRKYHPELDLGGPAAGLLEKAAATAQMIMNEGGYQLHTTGNPGADYAQLFASQDLLGQPAVILVNIFDQRNGSSQDQRMLGCGHY